MRKNRGSVDQNGAERGSASGASPHALAGIEGGAGLRKNRAVLIKRSRAWKRVGCKPAPFGCDPRGGGKWFAEESSGVDQTGVERGSASGASPHALAEIQGGEGAGLRKNRAVLIKRESSVGARRVRARTLWLRWKGGEGAGLRKNRTVLIKRESSVGARRGELSLCVKSEKRTRGVKSSEELWIPRGLRREAIALHALRYARGASCHGTG